MFWKIYFWGYVILSLVGAYGYIEHFLTIGDAVGIFMALFIGMGVYSYAYNKKFFNKQVWATGFYFVIIAFALEGIYRMTELDILSNFLISRYIIGTADWAVTSVLIMPACFALYILSKQGTPKTKKSKK